jgi:DMSO/TMAO reductase YedYZ molybdopterin-dependent catalytic subunit
MRQKLTLLAVIAAAGALLLSGFYFAGCNGTCTVDGPGELAGVEITEYQGVDLSSISDFRENSIKGPQYVDLDTYTLAITGLVDTPIGLTVSEVVDDHATYEKVVTLNCVEGWSVTILWEGVLVEDLIAEAGVQPEANTVIFHAYDGYTTSLPLDYIIENDIMLARNMNGVELPPERGAPFQLVAESKWGYKWIKWVTEIELSNDPEYRGYWESRGYSNSADYGERFFD